MKNSTLRLLALAGLPAALGQAGPGAAQAQPAPRVTDPAQAGPG